MNENQTYMAKNLGSTGSYINDDVLEKEYKPVKCLLFINTEQVDFSKVGKNKVAIKQLVGKYPGEQDFLDFACNVIKDIELAFNDEITPDILSSYAISLPFMKNHEKITKYGEITRLLWKKKDKTKKEIKRLVISLSNNKR